MLNNLITNLHLLSPLLSHYTKGKDKQECNIILLSSSPSFGAKSLKTDNLQSTQSTFILHLEERRGPIQFRRCWSQHYTAAMFLTWFGSEAGPLSLPVLHMFLHTDSLSTFLPLSLCHLVALRWTLPVTTVLQIAELWFLHMQIMQCFHTNMIELNL